MVSHQAKGMYSTVEHSNGVLKDQIQAIPVAVVKEDRLAGVAVKDDMVDGIGKMNAGFTDHGGRRATNIRKSILTPKPLTPKPPNQCG